MNAYNVEFKIRYADDFRSWEDLPIAFSRAFFENQDIGAWCKKVFLNRDIKEVRYNREGLNQGHYFTHEEV